MNTNKKTLSINSSRPISAAIPTRFPSSSASGQITIGIKPSPHSTASEINTINNTPTPNNHSPSPCGASLRPASSADLPVRAPQPPPPLEARVQALEKKLSLLLRERDLEDQILALEIDAAFSPLLRVIAQRFGTIPSRVRNKAFRKMQEADARQVACVMIHRLYPHLSLAEIGGLFALDHGTVLHSYRKVAEKRATDPIYRARFAAIECDLKLTTPC